MKKRDSKRPEEGEMGYERPRVREREREREIRPHAYIKRDTALYAHSFYTV
jgi:hypothetical protein